MTTVPGNIDDDIAKLSGVIADYARHRDLFQDANRTLNTNDVRLSIYGIPGNVLITALLNLKVVKTCMLNKNWWRQNIPEVPEHNIQFQADQFNNECKNSFYVLFFSRYEAVIRAIVRGVSPGACGNGFAAYETVYQCLFKTLKLQRHLPTLDFTRTIRNTFHNNGVYFNKKGQNETLTFKGRQYVFEHNRLLNFMFADLCYEVYEEFLVIADDINACADIKALPETLARLIDADGNMLESTVVRIRCLPGSFHR